MSKPFAHAAPHLAVLALVGGSLTGCAAVSEFRNGPALEAVESPQHLAGDGPVSLPMPAVQESESSSGSLWQAGARTFFADQRARRVGDILTVLISIDDSANLSNSTERERDSASNLGVPNVFGLESRYAALLGSAVDPANLLNTQGSSNSNGSGEIQRNEQIELTVAAIVTQVLPNGNMVVAGRQQVRVNQEVRDLTVTGVIRPTDITNVNTVRHTQMAEARISYGGKGTLSAMQAPRWGQKLVDMASPF